MSVELQPQKKRGLLVALVAGVFALVAVGVAALLANIAERKEQARHSYVKLVEVTENDVDPAKWGQNWPREYDAYKRTAEPTSTKYGGAAGASESKPAPEKADRDQREHAGDEGHEEPALLGLQFDGHEVLLREAVGRVRRALQRRWPTEAWQRTQETPGPWDTSSTRSAWQRRQFASTTALLSGRARMTSG